MIEVQRLKVVHKSHRIFQIFFRLPSIARPGKTIEKQLLFSMMATKMEMNGEIYSNFLVFSSGKLTLASRPIWPNTPLSKLSRMGILYYPVRDSPVLIVCKWTRCTGYGSGAQAGVIKGEHRLHKCINGNEERIGLWCWGRVQGGKGHRLCFPVRVTAPVILHRKYWRISLRERSLFSSLLTNLTRPSMAGGSVVMRLAWWFSVNSPPHLLRLPFRATTGGQTSAWATKNREFIGESEVQGLGKSMIDVNERGVGNVWEISSQSGRGSCRGWENPW